MQQIAGRVALDLSGRYVYKNYRGLLVDTGTIGRVPTTSSRSGATLDYFVRNWMYAGVGYALLLNDANVTPADRAPIRRRQLPRSSRCLYGSA